MSYKWLKCIGLFVWSLVMMTGYGWVKMVCISQQDYISPEEYKRLAQNIVQQNMVSNVGDNYVATCTSAK